MQIFTYKLFAFLQILDFFNFYFFLLKFSSFCLEGKSCFNIKHFLAYVSFKTRIIDFHLVANKKMIINFIFFYFLY